VPCDDTQDQCGDKDSIFYQGHFFVEKNGRTAEGFSSTDVLSGVHCRVSIEFLTYWLGDKIQEDRPWRSRFSKYILPSLDFDWHRVNKMQSPKFEEDDCRLVFLICQ
jgi:hypothetical protein